MFLLIRLRRFYDSNILLNTLTYYNILETEYKTLLFFLTYFYLNSINYQLVRILKLEKNRNKIS